MARHPRLILAGVALHLVQRGNNRNACFREDADYLTYLSHLRLLARRYGCHVHAYCLMTNHVHLLVTPSDADSCGLLMRDLGRSYVPYFNRRHGRTGTLWEGVALPNPPGTCSRAIGTSSSTPCAPCEQWRGARLLDHGAS